MTRNREPPRQALLRPAAARLYPGIPANTWMPAATMADQVWALWLRRGERVVPLRDRVLDPTHFEFRYGAGERASKPDPHRRTTDRTELRE